MSRALVTFAVGRHAELLDITRPLMQMYAARHGYEYLEGAAPHDRPPSWWKVPLLHEALGRFDEALWVDCDVAIVRQDRDLAAEVEPGFWQGLVAHHTPDGEVPNCGVWYVRRQMRPSLALLWSMTQYVNHVWWEQAGMLDLLGYRHESRPCHVADGTELFGRTYFLPLEWNSHEQNDRHPDPRFAHVTPNDVDWRLPRLKAYAERALAQIDGVLCA